MMILNIEDEFFFPFWELGTSVRLGIGSMIKMY